MSRMGAPNVHCGPKGRNVPSLQGQCTRLRRSDYRLHTTVKGYPRVSHVIFNGQRPGNL